MEPRARTNYWQDEPRLRGSRPLAAEADHRLSERGRQSDERKTGADASEVTACLPGRRAADLEHEIIPAPSHLHPEQSQQTASCGLTSPALNLRRKDAMKEIKKRTLDNMYCGSHFTRQ